MHFESFSFGSIQIDGTAYQHDVVIDRGEIRNPRKNRPRNFKSNSATRRSRLRRRFPGSAASSSSAAARTEACP